MYYVRVRRDKAAETHDAGLSTTTTSAETASDDFIPPAETLRRAADDDDEEFGPWRSFSSRVPILTSFPVPQPIDAGLGG